MDIMARREIVRVTEGERKVVDDDIALEMKLRVRVNGREVLGLFCSPSMVRELVTGLVATEGIIEGGWCADRMSIEYGDEIVVDIPAEGRVTERGAVRTSGCIGGITYVHDDERAPATYGGTVERRTLVDLFRKFQNISKPYQMTGCIHSAALAQGDRVLVHAEDIGRHNAVDKLVGYCLLEQVPFEDKIMLVSGRLSSEIAFKCARWRIPVVASRTAPTLRAVETAEKAGVTMVGFLREKRFNIYSHPERIL